MANTAAGDDAGQAGPAAPFEPPVLPMLAAPAGSTVPEPGSREGGLAYQPKWDGFRILVFRSGDGLVLQSRGGEDLTYAFPELLQPLLHQVPSGTVLDGELVVAHDERLWFEELTGRIRPRKEAGGWKIAELAAQFPASVVAFDLLAAHGIDLRDQPDRVRRASLVELAAQWRAPLHLSPQTSDPDVARQWFVTFEGAGLDGVIARPQAAAYTPGKRTLLKIKHRRTVEVVVAGWRPHKNLAEDGSPVVGSLLLGLYDEQGRLHHVGVTSSFTAARRRALVDELAPLAMAKIDGHPWADWAAPTRAGTGRMPGGVSRWSTGKDPGWLPLRPDRVAEVAYDHMSGDRFRHVATFQRWRPDRTAASCTYDQVERPVRYDLGRILGRTDRV